MIMLYSIPMPVKWIVLALAVLMYTMIVVFPGRKSWFALGAAVIMLLARAAGKIGRAHV
jgi:hypothetical protein